MNNSNNQPLISIGIPTYNSGKRISKALQSILAQGIEDIEVIISDNGSEDNTEEVCRAAVARDPRIRYYRQEVNKLPGFNFSFVLEQARGKYFMWLSDDDEFTPNVVQKYVDFLEANQEYVLVSGEINYWNKGEYRGKESGLNFEHTSGLKRSLQYYGKVDEGAMIYGLMRRKEGQQIPFWPIIGTDWHFVAGLAFLGKIKNLEFVGYNKEAGGLSADFHKYARIFGEAPVWGYIPYVRIATGAFAEYLWKNPVYRTHNIMTRIVAGFIAMTTILFRYYILVKPTIWGGNLLRFFKIKTPTQRRLEHHKNNSVQIS